MPTGPIGMINSGGAFGYGKTTDPVADQSTHGFVGGASIRGILANRPSPTSVPPGTFYVGTDTGTLYVSDGTTWASLSGGGGGLSNAFANITDGAHTAIAAGADTFRFHSSGGGVAIVVTDGDPTFGDSADVNLSNSGVIAGTYGDAANVPSLTIGVDGRVTAATTNAISNTPLPMDRITSFLFIGHSWIAGTAYIATGTQQFERQGFVGRLCGLSKVHENNVKHLGIQGTYLTHPDNFLGSQFGGWAGVLAFVLPYTSRNISDTTTIPLPQPALAPPYTSVITHGLNDIAWYGIGFNTVNFGLIRNAYKHALRAVLHRLRTGALYSSYRDTTGAIQWDSAFTFVGTWSDIARIGQNTGPAVKQTVTVGDTVTWTAPANLTASDVGMTFIADAGAWCKLNGALAPGATVAVITDSNGEMPTAGSYYMVIDDHVNPPETVRVTAGQGTVNLTFTPALTSNKNNGADIYLLQAGLQVNFSGTAANSVGSLGLQAQGMGGRKVAVTKRITGVLAGQTIIATVAGLGASDTYSTVQFDSVGIEALELPPIIFEKTVRFAYAFPYSVPQPADYATLNADALSVIAEFSGNSIGVADPDTYFFNRAGTLVSSITNVATSWHLTANDAATFATLPAPRMFSIEGERILITSITNNGGGDFTLDCGTVANRGLDGTSAQAHVAGRLCSSAFAFNQDGIHPNGYGHAVRAYIAYDAINALTSLTERQISLGQSATSQENRTDALGFVDNTYVQPRVSGAASAQPALNTLYYIKLYVPIVTIIDKIAVWVVAAGTATAARFGIYDLDVSRGRPGALIKEYGTAATTTPASVAEAVNYHEVEPGNIFLAVVNQGTTSSNWRMTGVTSTVVEQYCLPSLPTGATNLISGYSEVLSAGASLPANATPVPQISVPIVYAHVRVKHYA